MLGTIMTVAIVVAGTLCLLVIAWCDGYDRGYSSSLRQVNYEAMIKRRASLFPTRGDDKCTTRDECCDDCGKCVGGEG